MLIFLFLLLRSTTGLALQSIRDNEDAADSVGVKVLTTKRIIFVLAAAGAAVAGALWLATAISFQPKTYFSVQWTSYMIFMVLVGGLGTFEGAILGAGIFFLIESTFGSAGVWYLIGLGAVVLSLFPPRGFYGNFGDRTGQLSIRSTSGPLAVRITAAFIHAVAGYQRVSPQYLDGARQVASASRHLGSLGSPGSASAKPKWTCAGSAAIVSARGKLHQRTRPACVTRKFRKCAMVPDSIQMPTPPRWSTPSFRPFTRKAGLSLSSKYNCARSPDTTIFTWIQRPDAMSA